MKDDLMIVEEMAQILRVKPETFHSRKWQLRSGCPLFRRGRRLFAVRSEFWKWLRAEEKDGQVPWCPKNKAG